MNQASVRAVPIMNGFEGQFRSLRKSAWEAVQVDGIAQLYETEQAALLAAHEALLAHLTKDGVVGFASERARLRMEAEKLFPRPGKMVEVVKR